MVTKITVLLDTKAHITDVSHLTLNTCVNFLIASSKNNKI